MAVQQTGIELGAVVQVAVGEQWDARYRFFLSAHDGWHELIGFAQSRNQFVAQVDAECLTVLPEGKASVVKRGILVGNRIASFLDMEAMLPGSVIVYNALNKSYTKQDDGLWLGEGDDAAYPAEYADRMIASGTVWLSAPDSALERGQHAPETPFSGM